MINPTNYGTPELIEEVFGPYVLLLYHALSISKINHVRKQHH